MQLSQIVDYPKTSVLFPAHDLYAPCTHSLYTLWINRLALSCARAWGGRFFTLLQTGTHVYKLAISESLSTGQNRVLAKIQAWSN